MLRLKCLRCGDPADMDPREAYAWGCCAGCWMKHPLYNPAWHMRRWARFQRAPGFRAHPTYKALTEALAKMEAVPHGTLEVGDV